MMGLARLVFGFGGHGQRRQRREGGGEQPPQLQGTEGSFYRFSFVHFLCITRRLVSFGGIGDPLIENQVVQKT